MSYAERITRKLDAPRPLEVAALDVTVAGDRCALYLHSRDGTIIAVVPLRLFLAKARGERDANGCAFPLAAPDEVPPPPNGRGRRGHLPPARLQAYHAALAQWSSGAVPTLREAAQRHGLNLNTLKGWIQKQRRRAALADSHTVRR